jgi:hypothetical protein
MIKKIELGDLIRCKFWLVCSERDCFHYKVHRAERKTCFHPTPVHYCQSAEGFVYDIHLSDIDSNHECNPNLVFKARRECKKAEEEENRPHHKSKRSPRGWMET